MARRPARQRAHRREPLRRDRETRRPNARAPRGNGRSHSELRRAREPYDSIRNACTKKIRAFYEHTPAYKLDTWATTYFPARIALWLLVTTISRKVDQLNFPLDGLDTARGMSSEIVLLKKADGEIRYTGWFRKLQKTGAVIYTGFYMSEKAPLQKGRCVKVVFPMPDGNATVLLEPRTRRQWLPHRIDRQRIRRRRIYRVQKSGKKLRVWYIKSLHETFHLWVDEEGLVRCEHDVTFLGFSCAHAPLSRERCEEDLDLEKMNRQAAENTKQKI